MGIFCNCSGNCHKCNKKKEIIESNVVIASVSVIVAVMEGEG